jgi:hypothetical protein
MKLYNKFYRALAAYFIMKPSEMARAKGNNKHTYCPKLHTYCPYCAVTNFL